MKPTPLGKTYLEYQAELKEYNLAKTELAMQKIELGDVDDLKKLVDKSKQMIKDISGFEKKIQSEQKTLRKAVDNYNSISKNLDSMEKEKSPLYSKMVKLMDNIKKASKELGINANSIDGMQEAIKIQEEMSRRSALGGEASLMFMS
jgi:DNA repair ATPase RecN